MKSARVNKNASQIELRKDTRACSLFMEWMAKPEGANNITIQKFDDNIYDDTIIVCVAGEEKAIRDCAAYINANS